MKKNLNGLKVLAIASLSTPFLLFSEPAGAGINGQQVSVRATGLNWVCRSGISVTVSGINQRNEPKTWYGTTGCDGVAYTHNWWWKGNVTVNIHNRVFNQRKTCSAGVPVNQGLFNNWFGINCW
jgi:hypothetical protein